MYQWNVSKYVLSSRCATVAGGRLVPMIAFTGKSCGRSRWSLGEPPGKASDLPGLDDWSLKS